MSIRIMSQVWSDQTIETQGELLVLLALADFSNDSGLSWPSIETLANKSKYSLRGIQGVIKKLITNKKINVKTGGGPPGSTNVYQILNTPANFANRPPQTTANTPANGRKRPPQSPGVDLRGIRQDPSEEIHKEIRGVVPKENCLDVSEIIKKEVGRLYNRPDNQPLSYIDQTALVEVCRRPNVLSEIEIIKKLKGRADYFPESMSSLLAKWDGTVDRARKPNSPIKHFHHGNENF